MTLKKRRPFPLTKPDGRDLLTLIPGGSVLSPDGGTLATIEGTGDAWIWDLKKEQPTARLIKQKQCQSLLFNLAGQQGIILDAQNRCTIWDKNFEKVITSFGNGNGGVLPQEALQPLAVSSDGKYLAVRSSSFSTGQPAMGDFRPPDLRNGKSPQSTQRWDQDTMPGVGI